MFWLPCLHTSFPTLSTQWMGHTSLLQQPTWWRRRWSQKLLLHRLHCVTDHYRLSQSVPCVQGSSSVSFSDHLLDNAIWSRCSMRTVFESHLAQFKQINEESHFIAQHVESHTESKWQALGIWLRHASYRIHLPRFVLYSLGFVFISKLFWFIVINVGLTLGEWLHIL